MMKEKQRVSETERIQTEYSYPSAKYEEKKNLFEEKHLNLSSNRYPIDFVFVSIWKEHNFCSVLVLYADLFEKMRPPAISYVAISFVFTYLSWLARKWESSGIFKIHPHTLPNDFYLVPKVYFIKITCIQVNRRDLLFIFFVLLYFVSSTAHSESFFCFLAGWNEKRVDIHMHSVLSLAVVNQILC